MSTRTKEKIYLAITVFCVLMCAVLLISVYRGKPIPYERHSPRANNGEENKQVEQKPEQKEEKMVIDENYFGAMLEKYLPEGFPAEDIKADISSDGHVSLSGTIRRSKLEEYMDASGVEIGAKTKLMFMLLPKSCELQAGFSCSMDDESGMLQVTPVSLVAAGSEIDLSMFPQTIFDSVNQGVNKMLIETGYYYKSVRFSDGAVELLPQ